MAWKEAGSILVRTPLPFNTAATHSGPPLMHAPRGPNGDVLFLSAGLPKQSFSLMKFQISLAYLNEVYHCSELASRLKGSQ